jgi:hypothetical protein
MGFLLFLLAWILYIPLTVVNIIVVIIKNIKSYAFFKVIDGYFLQTAADIDRFGNSNLRTLFNLTLIKENGYKFGKIQETISSVLGKNQRDNTLTKTGKILVLILDFISRDHCKKSIREF